MQKISLLLIMAFTAITALKAQTKPGPAEKKLTDSICNCVNQVNVSSIKTTEAANAAIMDCFTKYTSILMEIAEERKIEFTNDDAMSQIGTDIGKNLLKQNCSNFIKLSVISNKQDESASNNTSGSTTGTFKRMENKGFNYIVLLDADSKERTFLWLRQFAGSENLSNRPASYAGKKVKINWKEIEVYLPQAKGYYKVKEITAVDIL
ncbi:hypothetical protein ABDD95_05225 [Mucilaginibacter sp. PAMB04274]|uniref:hypothetical protein n=1 Tax=Mucilaginibacter sp. PAMB04274 TaxID=3138568 RepID=UPI0031F7001C